MISPGVASYLDTEVVVNEARFTKPVTLKRDRTGKTYNNYLVCCTSACLCVTMPIIMCMHVCGSLSWVSITKPDNPLTQT